MLILTSPSALLAFLGLLVPLAIHLWNRRPGREVAVGSLRWLAAGANRRLRNLRLEQIGLLLLRMALLAVLALAVAGLAWRQPLPAGRGQVLVSPALAGTGSLAAVRPTIDSLRRRGYGLRWLAAGFPIMSAADWRADSLGQPVSKALSSADNWLWQRVQQAGGQFAGQPLYVVTPTALGGFGGTHAALPAGLSWQVLPTGRTAQWLARATASADSLHLLAGKSDEATVSFQLIRIKKPLPGAVLRLQSLPALRYEVAAGAARLQPLPAGPGQPLSGPIAVQPAALRVLLYAPASAAAEARYWRAALRAAAVGLPGSLALTVTTTAPDTAARPDWLFWLGEAPAPAAWRGQVRRGLRLWQQAAGPGVADTASLLLPEAAPTEPIASWRRGRQPLAGEPLWADSHGQTVLARQPLGAGATYAFATRLHPAWNALPASPALPALLLSVLAPAPSMASLAPHDQRRFDAAQLPKATARGRLVASGLAPAVVVRGLRPWLVLVAGILLALERWLAARRGASTFLSLA